MNPYRLIFACVLLVSSLASAQQPASNDASKEQSSEVAPEYASPRDAMKTFLDTTNRLRNDKSNDALWQRVYGTLDMPRSTGKARQEVVWQLLGVFNSLGKIDPDTMLPGSGDIDKQNLKRFEFFPDNPRAPARELFAPAINELGDPPASITLTRGEDGAWRFAAPTLNNVPQLYNWASKRGVQYGFDVRQMSDSVMLRSYIPKALKGRFILGFELWQWIGILLAAFLAVCTDFFSRLFATPLVRRLVAHYLGHPDDDLLRQTVRPMGLAIGAIVFMAIVQLLGLSGMPLTVLIVAGKVVMVVCVTWALWMLTDLIAGVMADRARHTDSTFDDMLIPLIRKTLKLFIVSMGLIYVADSFDIELLPLLGSLGIAGLAISFAAQDMVKNLFGGLSIFMDRPFKIGDRILYKGYDGVIEDIGFRITRLRTLTGHLVTIPNGGITSEPIENIARRPYIRRLINVTITYDTPREKIEQAVQILRDLMEEPGIAEPIHGKVGWDEYPPRAYFNDYNADSLNIIVIYWFFPPAYWDYLEHAQKFNLRLFEEFEKAGIEFAFPTQTLFLAGDPKRQLTMQMLNRDAGPQ